MLPGDQFDAGWRAKCSVRPVGIRDVDPFIQAHYLHKRPAIVTLCLLMDAGRTPVGCTVFSCPPRETEKRYGGHGWELARLFILDSVPRNGESWLIGQSIRWIRRNRPEVDFLVSYADPSAGHAGAIYRASNWTPDGRTDQGRKTPRFDLVDAETGVRYGRAGHVPPGRAVTRLPRVSKNRFVYRMKGKRCCQATVK